MVLPCLLLDESALLATSGHRRSTRLISSGRVPPNRRGDVGTATVVIIAMTSGYPHGAHGLGLVQSATVQFRNSVIHSRIHREPGG